ncbi:DUF2520 domain-containing protein [Bacteroidales bacterium OttesenSCG-928-B11]|nr:DUF2520 domain-containing protein [Bacteroidales bacterium OttesenSCG-928-C03]MDL2312098.1 DUF2520 domain-containing protein [Bacteroidales bacterium OttesenSCG-928-B11]MDL2326070.1 DUF2520 domain-containing protein [Bacteroidales bacterium OttesenSCG-928-A14]
MNRFTIIGTGNVAAWFADRIRKTGGVIKEVYGRTPGKTADFAARFGSLPINDLRKLSPHSDLYIFAVTDDAYPAVIAEVPFMMPCAIHTAGAVPISVFKDKASRFGTIYPFQTISAKGDFDDLTVPLCVEGESPETEDYLLKTAILWSETAKLLNEEQRQRLHLAAVFSCNFTNALYGIAFTLLKEKKLDPQLLFPLLENTLQKIKTMSPKEAQTGPAIRRDQQTINGHLSQLTNPQFREVYELMTKIIQNND